jgi:hypothetical protein
MLLLFWATRDPLSVPPLPGDDLVAYVVTVKQSDTVSLSGIYVIPPTVMSEEDT